MTRAMDQYLRPEAGGTRFCPGCGHGIRLGALLRAVDRLKVPRDNDVVWRVRFSDQWLYVYILLEFQSSVDKFMALRVMT